MCKDIDAKDVWTETMYCWLAAMDSAHTPNTTFKMQLWHQSIPTLRVQARSESFGGLAIILILISYANILLLRMYWLQHHVVC